MLMDTSDAIASIDHGQHSDYVSLAKAIDRLCANTGMTATTKIVENTNYHKAIRIHVHDRNGLRLTAYYNWHHILAQVSRVTFKPQGLNKIIKSLEQAVAYTPNATTEAIVQMVLAYIRINESKYVSESYVDTECSEVWLGMDKIKAKTSIEFIIYQDDLWEHES